MRLMVRCKHRKPGDGGIVDGCGWQGDGDERTMCPGCGSTLLRRVWLQPDDRKPREWSLIRGCRLYNYALLDEVHHGIQAAEWERRIALAIEDAYAEGFRRGVQTLEEKLGA